MKRHILTICLALLALLGYSQETVTVTGVVTGASDGEPLIGASVRVKDTTMGVNTDIDGNYRIANIPADAVLVVSYVGFNEQEVPVKGRTEIDIVLSDSSAQLEELVVIGYGTVKKSDLTSSISTVKGKQITEMQTGNAMDALQGKVSGVQISTGGSPGDKPKVQIRGITTVNGSDPLYVVDGMPVGDNINFLNTNDIESMEVLKDASATAIYGTRGSNGVILITTKKGVAGKTSVSFSASVGFKTINKPDIAKASEYEKVFKARYANDGRVAAWVGADNVSDADGTDWWDETIHKTALVQNYTLGVSGGSETMTYNFSVGYYRNESQYDVGYWDKLNMRLNVDWNPIKYVQFGVEMAPTMEQWENSPNQISSCMSMDPTTPIYINNDPEQGYQRSYNNQTWNPVATISRAGNDKSRKMEFLMSPYLQIKPIDQLVLRTQFGANVQFERYDAYTPLFWIDALEKSDENKQERHYKEWCDWSWTNTITFMETFNKVHNLTVMGGFTAERYAYYKLWGQRKDIPGESELLHEVSAGTGDQEASSETEFNTLASVLGRIMYNYDGRYYLTASIRSDGSSRFPSGSKWATFPSVSLAWRIAQENFAHNWTWMNDWKLRLGWGKVGNQAISNGAYMSQLTSSDYVYGGERVPGVAIGTVGNNTLKWETVEDYDIGMDLLAFNSRLSVTADFYVKKSHDMLYDKQNILASGFPAWNATLTSNIGSMKATGWELAVNWRDQSGDFRYDLGVQLSGVRNKAIKFSGEGPVDAAGNKLNDGSLTRSYDGQLIGRFYGYQCLGIFQSWSQIYAHSDENGTLLQPSAQPGDLIFADLNHDGVLDENDKTFIGNPYPDLTMGVNLSLGYKNFDFTANFYGTFGNDVFNLTKQRYSGADGSNVYAGTYDSSWREDNRNAEYPRLSASDLNNNWGKVSSFYVEDGSYFRCKLLTIGYTLPKWLTRNCTVRLYASAQNLFTITGYSGLDPERPQYDGSVLETGIDDYGTPAPRTYLFGLDFKF